ANDLLLAMGSPAESAPIIAKSLVKSDCCGIYTHGIGQLPMYARMLNDGAIDPLATTTITHKTDCIISVDGHDGFGQLVGELATTAGIEATQKSGMAMVAIHNASHLGRLGEWAEQAANAGLVFTAFSNTGGGALNVAAFGGHERKLSTNPVAFAIPTFKALPYNIIVDFATSQISGAVIQKHYRTHTPLHGDWTTTSSGDALSDAADFMKGRGALLPLGGRTTGHKGFGLALIAELLGGIAGGLVAGQHDPQWFSNAAMFSFVDPLHFQSVDEIEQRIHALTKHLSEDNVRFPGQGTYQRSQVTQKQGVSMPSHVLQSLIKLAKHLDVNVAEEIASSLSDVKSADEKLKSW
ncbi:MAG: putative oxidoreductase, partial [Planctomycetota bacterium]